LQGVINLHQVFFSVLNYYSQASGSNASFRQRAPVLLAKAEFKGRKPSTERAGALRRKTANNQKKSFAK